VIELKRIEQVLANIVGYENVSVDPADMVTMCVDMTPSTEPPKMPQVMVKPGNPYEVAEILRFANRENIAVIPQSNTAIFGGRLEWTSAPAMMLDLRRMNRVIEVNEDENYAVIEPGVSFAQMYRYLATKHPNVVLPAVPMAVPTASVLSNYLDSGDGTGPGYSARFGTAFGNNEGFITGLEVVLPTGEIARTGSWAIRDASARFSYRKGITSDFTGLFTGSVGSLGVVTKMGLILCEKPYDIVGRVYGAKTIEECTEKMHKLSHKGVLPMVSGSYWLLAVFMRADKHRYPWELNGGKEALPEDYLKKWREELGFPGEGPDGWYILGYQPVKDEYEKEAIEKTLEKAERDWNLESIDIDRCETVRVEYELKECMARGSPGNSRGRYISFRGGGVLWLTGHCCYRDYPKLVRNGFQLIRDFGFDPSAHMYLHYGRVAHLRFIVPFNRGDPEEFKRIERCGAAGLTKLMNLGHLFPRPSGATTAREWERAVPGYMFLHRKIKDALDPNGIMNPGSGRN
jgi:FAD/FMN-containing dehydrogenase